MTKFLIFALIYLKLFRQESYTSILHCKTNHGSNNSCSYDDGKISGRKLEVYIVYRLEIVQLDRVKLGPRIHLRNNDL